MAHILAEIRIENYKSIVNETFELSNYTPLIGYNNAGKSNILNAIKWLLRKSSLPADCFNNIGNPVVMEGKITGITQALLQSMSQGNRSSISPYIINDEIKIKRVQNQPGESTTTIRLLVFNPNAANGADPWMPNPNGIDAALTSLFPEPIQIGAMENAEEDVSKSTKSSTIGKLLAEIIGPIEQAYGANVTAALQGVRDILDAEGQNRAPELAQFDASVNQKIDSFFPGVNVRVHVPTPELKEVFSKGTIRVYEPQATTGRDVGSMGHGAQRSIQMALVRHLADMKRAAQNHTTTTLLLIDEPELYLHPHAIEVIREALKSLSNHGYQVIFSTHSAMMVTHEDVENAVLIRKRIPQGTIKLITMKAAVPQIEQNMTSQLHLLFSLSNSSFILFAERVILTEGITEQRILPKILEVITGQSIGLHKYALVKQDGVTNTRKCMAVLDVMGLPTKAIVDLDYVFKNAVRDGFLPANDPDILACHQNMATLATANGINLGSDGWPVKNNSPMSVPEAFELLAAQQTIQQNILNLRNKLLQNNIWIWKDGAIERCLGLTGKNEQIWATFVNQIKANPIQQIVHDYGELNACVQWLIS